MYDDGDLQPAFGRRPLNILDIVATTLLVLISVIAGAVVGVFMIRFSVDILIPLKGMDEELWNSAMQYGAPVGAFFGLYAAFQLRQRIKNSL